MSTVTPQPISKEYWAIKYVGIPYCISGLGNDNKCFNCWGLVRYAYSKEFGIELPIVDIDNVPQELVRKTFSNWHHIKEGISALQDGDGMIVRSRRGPHVGIYLDIDGGKILHAVSSAGQVIATNIHSLSAYGMSRAKFYRHSSFYNTTHG